MKRQESMGIYQFFRNREVKKEGLFYALSGTCIFLVLLIFFSFRTAVFSVLTVFFCAVFHFASEKKRYDKLAVLSDEIEQILHGRKADLLEDCDEGELYILVSQLKKLVSVLKEQSEKSEEGKRFLADAMADISHQLKTPLTSMNLVISFLGGESLSERKRHELVGELTKLTSKIEWLIYALLRISKLDAGTVEFEKREVSLKEMLDRVKETAAIPLELRELTWEAEIPEELHILCDRAWLEEAFGNIVKNCMEHTPAGGGIFVSAEDNAIYTLIRIRDSGTGFDEEDLPHIFERFYRGKNAGRDSVGIGLALARKIILSQNGVVKAGNRKDGEGAEFSIRIYKAVV